MKRAHTIMVVVAAVALLATPTIVSASDENNSVVVHFHFGETGIISSWTDVIINPGDSTIDIVSRAADTLGISLRYEEYYNGIYIKSINEIERDTVPDSFWNILIWDPIDEEWHLSEDGIKFISLSGLHAIALAYDEWDADFSYIPAPVFNSGIGHDNPTDQTGGENRMPIDAQSNGLNDISSLLIGAAGLVALVVYGLGRRHPAVLIIGISTLTLAALLHYGVF